jgi:uncharacterized membrane protein YesL
MYLNLFLLVLIGLILFGLVRATESILDIRQKRRDRDEDLKTYL